MNMIIKIVIRYDNYWNEIEKCNSNGYKDKTKDIEKNNRVEEKNLMYTKNIYKMSSEAINYV